AVVMAVNVVIALYYYLQWTATLFRAPQETPEETPAAAVPEETPAQDAVRAPTRHGAPASLTVAIALTAVVGVLLSGAPQAVLRFAAVNLF
ncbi:NADH-quinone oxidoreductase subunit N, partial [Streptomyces mirabilis]